MLEFYIWLLQWYYIWVPTWELYNHVLLLTDYVADGRKVEGEKEQKRI